MKLYSIIIPVFNCETYLEQCVKSVLAQKYTNWELILVDDGSTDRSAIICDQYISDKIRVIHKKNEGVAIARKVGVDNAKGDFVAFVDSDDLISPDYLEKANEVIEIYSVDIVKFGLQIEKKDGSTYIQQPKFNGYFSKERLKSEVYPILIHDERANYLGANVIGVFRSSCIKPFLIADSRAKIGEDSASVIPAIMHSQSVFFLNEALYFYRYNCLSATKGCKVFGWDNPEIVAKHILKYVEQGQFDFKLQVSRRVVHDIFNVALTRFYQKKNYRCVSKEIRSEIGRPFYRTSIHDANFKHNLKAQMMLFCLKKNFMLPIFILSKVKLLMLR